MTKVWACGIAINLAAYFYVWYCTRGRRCIFWSQSVMALFMLAKVAAFYAYHAHLFTRQGYRWLAWAGDVSTSAGDIAVAACVIFGTEWLSRSTITELALVVSIAWHQMEKLNWHWSVELFRNLPQDEWLTSLTTMLSNYSTLALMCMVVTAQSRQRRKHEPRRTQA